MLFFSFATHGLAGSCRNQPSPKSKTRVPCGTAGDLRAETNASGRVSQPRRRGQPDHWPRVSWTAKLAIVPVRVNPAICHFGRGFTPSHAKRDRARMNQKNGLLACSWPTVVRGPCPGQIIVSDGSVRMFSRTFCLARSHDWLPRPMDAEKMASPTMAR